MTRKISDLRASMRYMADNNQYQYGRWSGAGNNTQANPSDGYHYDCGTGLSWCIRDALNGHKHDNSPLSAYCWPNNDGSAYFDSFLLNNGFERHNFSVAAAKASGYKTIPVIGSSHVWAYYDITQNLQFELNDGYGSGSKSVDIHNTVLYSDAKYMYLPIGWEEDGESSEEETMEGSEFDLSTIWSVKKPGTGCEGLTRTIQSVLNAKNGAGLVVDGDFGDLTEQAVKDWQAKYPACGKVDGEVGPLTWSDLICRNV